MSTSTIDYTSNISGLNFNIAIPSYFLNPHIKEAIYHIIDNYNWDVMRPRSVMYFDDFDFEYVYFEGSTVYLRSVHCSRHTRSDDWAFDIDGIRFEFEFISVKSVDNDIADMIFNIIQQTDWVNVSMGTKFQVNGNYTMEFMSTESETYYMRLEGRV